MIRSILRHSDNILCIPLNDVLPNFSSTDLRKCTAVFEDGEYLVSFESDESSEPEIDRILMAVNGKIIDNVIFEKLERGSTGKTVFSSTSYIKPFLLQYDLVVLSFIVQFKDATSKELYSSFLLCFSRFLENAENVQKMVQELISFDDSKITNWMFGHAHNEKSSFHAGGWCQHTYRSLISYIQLLEEVHIVYRRNITYFKTMGRHSIENVYVFSPCEKIKEITEVGFHWLMQNTDMLAEIDHSEGVSYNGKYYLPMKMKNPIKRKTWDVYENRVILSFLQTVLLNAEAICRNFDTHVLNESKVIELINAGIPKNYRASIITVKSVQVACYKALLQKLRRNIDSLKELFVHYRLMFGLSVSPLCELPRKTKTFQEVKPYIQVFGVILRWFKYGEFSLNKENLILQVKTIDKLFEYFCLLKLLNFFDQHGFEKAKDTRTSYNYPYIAPDGLYRNEDDLANTYVLEKENTVLTLYYQPVVSAERLENGLSLYRTTLRMTSDKDTNQQYKANYYTPDFILKFFNIETHETEYVILDSKYSSRDTIKRYKISEIIQKYSCEIVDTKSGEAPVMVWVLQGRVKKEDAPFCRYQNAPLLRQFKLRRSYGIVSVNTIQDPSKELWHEIKQRIPWV